MQQAQYLAIVNPAAGGGRCGREVTTALDRARRAGLSIDQVDTERPGHAIELARTACQQGRHGVIAVGGDGTSFEVVNGLMSASSASDRPRLAFLPLGTGNSFLRDFGDDPASLSLAALEQGRERKCDVVRLTHQDGATFSLNLISFGFVADVNNARARTYAALGQAGYVAAVLHRLARLASRPFPMKLDQGSWDRSPAVFVSFNNSRFTGGKMMMAPDARTDDGRVDVITAGQLSRISLLRTFPKIFRGTHTAHQAVRCATASSIEFDLDRTIDVMVDGEALSLHPTRIDVLPSALTIVA